ncbi:hypothetical protein AUR64_17385 [Haloprofundus marisrubri]|uniref:Uncharacterized protein n=1 Tax=Haloprofundus marisrubri TaxID=1514971 RepID=A0A0W1R532_9EURY|nr:hypothetical protein [Haloprofundus marisrubri]KTG08456.1 hypothetical protein AUR64_17385 [Haloprofundus marisrubri]
MNRIELENRLDRDARRFLAAVDYYGGEATTSEIRLRTGLSPSKTHTRYGVLEECGLIDITRADVGHGNRDPPKVAHLTGDARREIERGLLRDIDVDRTPEEIRDHETELRAAQKERDELRERVNVLEELLRRDGGRIDDLEDDVDELFAWGEGVDEWRDVAEDAIRSR